MSDTIQEIIKGSSNKYRYQLLSRLESDCKYYLGAGNRHSKHLWSGSVKDHIEDMTALYMSFRESDRPEWLTLEQIRAYGEAMAPGEKDDSGQYKDVHELVDI